jgi:CBS domain-containing protein
MSIDAPRDIDDVGAPDDAGADGSVHVLDAVGRIAAFLLRYPPFKELTREERERVAGATEVRTLRPGAPVFVEGGPPAAHLFMVRDGSVELVIGGLVVNVLQQGELFGTRSVLATLPPDLTARARDETTLLLIPREVALEVLSRPAGVRFLVTSFGDRLVRVTRAMRAATDPRGVAVSSLLTRAPVLCPSDTPVHEAARLMRDEVESAILVETRDGLGIVSNADLRNKVVAAGGSSDAPVSSIMTTPVLTIRGDQLASEASIEMMRAGVNHLVVVDAQDRPLGVISASGLMTPDALSPLALRRSIAAAHDEEQVVEASRLMSDVFVSLVDSGLGAEAISRVVTLQSDALTQRLLELAIERHGPAPVAFAWLALGSAGRNELTLASDQDNAMAYEDTDDPAVDAYFERVAIDVNAGLDRCGFKLDESGVLARDVHWRMSQSQWVQVFNDTFEVWDLKHTLRASVAFDFRRVTGDLDVIAPLVEVLLQAREHPSLLNRIARTATDIRSPLGFRQRLTGPIDIKRMALLPIQNMARYYALGSGVTVAATLDRLAAIRELGGRGAETTAALPEAFKAVWHLRLRHHANAIRAGRRLDDAIDSTKLRPLTYAELQEALRLIAAAQRRVPRVLMPGDLGAHM